MYILIYRFHVPHLSIYQKKQQNRFVNFFGGSVYCLRVALKTNAPAKMLTGIAKSCIPNQCTLEVPGQVTKPKLK